MAFSAASPYGLDIIDRNSDRNPDVYRDPDLPNTTVFPNVRYNKTGGMYTSVFTLDDVNTVDGLAKNVRRLIEIMGMAVGCG